MLHYGLDQITVSQENSGVDLDLVLARAGGCEAATGMAMLHADDAECTVTTRGPIERTHRASQQGQGKTIQRNLLRYKDNLWWNKAHHLLKQYIRWPWIRQWRDCSSTPTTAAELSKASKWCR